MRRLAAVAILTTLIVPIGAVSASAAPSSSLAVSDGPINVVVTGQEQIGRGVTHSTLRVTGAAGPATAQLLSIDLTRGHVRLGLLTPGVVAAREPVDTMAEQAGAIAATNADYFNLFEDASHGNTPPTNSASGAEMSDGKLIKGPVPFRQRYGETGARPLNDGSEVFGQTTSGKAVVGKVRLKGVVRSPVFGTVALDGLNQYGIDRGGIDAFTPQWGAASRERAACGSENNRRDPCTTDVVELLVRHNTVASIASTPGSGQLPKGTVALLGREAGAATLRKLKVGDPVQVSWHADATAHFRWAVGGSIIEHNGTIPAGLDQRPNPRTAVGVSADGQHVFLIVVTGRTDTSAGITIAEIAQLERELGAANAVTLDGGGSSAMVGRHAGDQDITVWNVPSDGQVRAVANGIGVFTR